MISMELNAWDRRLLDRYLWFYEQLASGAREPQTPAQVHFIGVCRSSSKPATQHEIAYIKHLKAQQTCTPMRGGRSLAAHSSLTPLPEANVDPTPEAIEVVDAIEEAALTKSPWASVIAVSLSKIRDSYRLGQSNARDRIADAALWTSTILSDAEFTHGIERWMGSVFNTLSNAATQKMDAVFVETGPISGDPSTQPLWHRFFEGHTPVDAWNAVCTVFPDKNMADRFVECLKALGSDMASTAGLPVVTFTHETYEAYVALTDTLGLSRRFAEDLASANLAELMSATIPILAAILNWNKADTERFHMLIGSFGIAAAYGANPFMAILSVVMLARAFHLAQMNGSQVLWAQAMTKGGLFSGVVFAISASLAGPAWVGLIAGVCAILVLKHCKRPIAAGLDAATVSRLIRKVLRREARKAHSRAADVSFLLSGPQPT